MEKTAAAPKETAAEQEKSRHARLMSWFRQEMQRQSANRYQMAIDEDYYDSLQYTTEETRTMLDRGQMPVAWNEIKPTIDWMIGTERRNRTDFNVVARNDDSEESSDDAKTKSKLLKYLDDVNRTGFERSYAFESSLKSGLGWLEIGIRADPDQETIFTRAESWRNIIYDSLGPRQDLEDSRFIFRFREVDLDVAEAYFPAKVQALRNAARSANSDTYLSYFMGRPVSDQLGGESILPERWTLYDPSAWLNNARQRVLLIEAWYREPQTLTTGQGAGSYDRTKMRMRCTVMTEEDILIDGWSPYKHNRFPFVPIWCYRRKRDNAPYGAIRAIRGPQDGLNKALSKATWEASANQTLIEVDAIDPKVMRADEIRDELSAPDGFAVLARGGLSKVRTVDRQTKISGHAALADRGLLAIRNTGGVTGENLGQETSATSGKAIGLKQEQGSTNTAELFDNLLAARQMEGEITLSLIEQYYDQPKVFSIAGDRGKYEYTKINQVGPDGDVIGDITSRSAQFVIGEQPWRLTLMMAMSESLMATIRDISAIQPAAAAALLPYALDLGDFPNKRSMLRDVRKALGQPDPDEEQTPEQLAAAQQQQQMADRTAQLSLEKLEAEVKNLSAQGASLEARALQQKVLAMYEAMQAGQVVATLPAVAPIADEILRGSGYQDAGGDDPNIVQPQQTVPSQSVAPVDDGSPQSIPTAAPDLRPAAGDNAAVGIETVRPDGVSRA